MSSIRYILSVLILTLLLSACSVDASESYGIPWTYSDLRALDAADALLPSQDIIAIYIRQDEIDQLPNANLPKLSGSSRIQYRLDFLDLSIPNNQDIYLAIDHAPGGSTQLPLSSQAEIEWDTLITIPTTELIQATDSQGRRIQNLALQVMRDPSLDTITISFTQSGLTEVTPLGIYSQIFTTPAGSRTVTDITPPFHSSDSPPERAPVLFAFWNTFPAYTPAQSLRRWDGAHTGPLGGRHGLYNLLRAARNHHIPLTLLDLKTPTSLSALDYAGGLDLVRNLADQGLLILPDALPIATLPGWFQTLVADNSRQTALDFDLTASQFIYAPLSDGLPAHYPMVFTAYPFNKAGNEIEISPVTVYHWKERSVIPIPTKLPTNQATLDGPSLEVRRALIETAIAANRKDTQNSSPFLILGGNLPHSTWGEPMRARATFEYLKAHPWIKPLDSNGLLSTQPSQSASPTPPSFSPTPTNNAIIRNIIDASPGPIADSAFDAYMALYAPLPSSSPELIALRENFIGQVSMLLAAAEWDANPASTVSCDHDLDMDGNAECILASDQIFTILDPADGSLVFAFARTTSGTHQIVGPTSQFVVGLSDPINWDLSAGLKADPFVVPGAFADNLGPYQVIPGENHIAFKSDELTKTYRLGPGGLRFEYQSKTPLSWKLPLVLDPWNRFELNWGERYQEKLFPDGWSWSISSGPQVLVQASINFSPQTFTITRDIMGKHENPNYEYPPGHYLPFPLALVEIKAFESGYTDILLLP